MSLSFVLSHTLLPHRNLLTSRTFQRLCLQAQEVSIKVKESHQGLIKHKLQSGLHSASHEYFLSLPDIQKHVAPGHGEDETEGEEEEEEAEEDLSSSSSEDNSEEEEEAGMGRGRHGQSGTRQAQLEWDDSTLPY